MKIYNDKKSDEFISMISSHPIYGSEIGDNYVMVITDDPDKPFKFGFIEMTNLSEDVKAFCFDKFQKYFPTCELIGDL